MTLEEAKEQMRQGKKMQPGYFGVGWGVVFHAKTNDFYDNNPHTGSMTQHRFEERDETEWRQITLYEYAGFVYEVHKDAVGFVMTPIEQQHAAARKMKHIMAAKDCFRDDLKAGRTKW